MTKISCRTSLTISNKANYNFASLDFFKDFLLSTYVPSLVKICCVMEVVALPQALVFQTHHYIKMMVDTFNHSITPPAARHHEDCFLFGELFNAQ